MLEDFGVKGVAVHEPLALEDEFLELLPYSAPAFRFMSNHVIASLTFIAGKKTSLRPYFLISMA